MNPPILMDPEYPDEIWYPDDGLKVSTSSINESTMVEMMVVFTYTDVNQVNPQKAALSSGKGARRCLAKENFSL